MKYSKKILLSNIEYLIRKNDIKIGELESCANVSVGYFSRLKNNENDSMCPSIDTISLIADKLNVSINTLLFIDLTTLTETEQYIIKFIEELTLKTEINQLEWDKESIADFYDISKYNRKSNPLGYTSPNSYGEYEIEYKSLYADEKLKLIGPIYKLFRVKRDVYISKVEYDFDPDTTYELKSGIGYELYFVEKTNSKTLHKICGVMIDSNKLEIFDIMENLYKVIEESQSKLKLDDEARIGIKEFLNGEDDIDDLPF